MPSLRRELNRSWARVLRSARDLASALPVATPTTVRDLIARLRTVESVHHERPMHTDDGAAINGRVVFDLKSDGSWSFSGHVRATGFPSYVYGVQAWLQTPDGTVIAAATSGRVFGTDTPGPRQRDFTSSGTNQAIADQWASLRAGAGGIGFRLHAELGGVLGAAVDVLGFLARGVLANMLVGPTGWVIVLGNELADLGVQIGTPDVLSALIVSGGVLFIMGPAGLVPAVLAGIAAAEIADVRHRAMNQTEIAFAKRVFGDHIDYGRVRLTDLSQSGDRKFVMPSIDGSILVNLGSVAFTSPLTYTSQKGEYLQPGALFIHELVHAWQITQRTLPSVISDMSSNYDYHSGSTAAGRLVDRSWATRGWDSFNIEQQAHIVNDWYGAHVRRLGPGYHIQGGVPVTDLDSPAALTDPAYRFIRDHIRLGAP